MKTAHVQKSIVVLGILVLIGTVLFAGCQKKESEADKPTEIIIGAGSAMNPYWYLDGNNQLTGFEKAVLDEIDSRLPQYTFKYQIYDFSNILLSLEAGKVDVAVHQYEYNIERDQKYLYGKVGYTTYPLWLAVREDEDRINSFEDLAGKILVSTSTTNNAYYIANQWNEEHGQPFKIIFASTTALALEDLVAGRADAIILMRRHIDQYKTQYQAAIKAVGDGPVANSNAYYLFSRQNGQELQKVFDEQLQALKDDGTLVKLSHEWLGGDFTAKD
jgi:L-cystine transport system substrate-binding protein